MSPPDKDRSRTLSDRLRGPRRTPWRTWAWSDPSAVELGAFGPPPASPPPSDPPPADDVVHRPEVDVEALARLGTPCGTVRIAGASVPILLPHAAPADPSEFDAATCAAGLACFVRPRVAGDDLDALIPASTAHMLVRELAPGIRARMPIELLPEGSLN
jgi:hypothetical protein